MAISKNKKLVLILPVILAVLCIYTYISYNNFVAKDEALKNAWTNLQARYQRRFDMIPALVNVVKASSDYEKLTLTKLATIRSQKAGVVLSGDPNSDLYKKLEAEQGDFANTFNQMIAVVENYPEIKSQQNYVRLQDQIKGTESRIKFARKDFNEAVMNYNKYVRSFPSNITASIFGFKMKNGFAANAAADAAPEINFYK